MTDKWLIVTVGGAALGAPNSEMAREIRLRCPDCLATYPMAEQPVALSLGPEGATLLTGYVEVCPACYATHGAGDVLAVELGHVEKAEVVL